MRGGVSQFTRCEAPNAITGYQSRLRNGLTPHSLHPGEEPLAIGRWVRRFSIPTPADAERGYYIQGLRRFQVLLKLAVLREHIVQGLVDDFVRRCVNEGGVLIDQGGGCSIKPDRCTDLARLLISMSGIDEPPIRLSSGDFLAGDHPLRRERDLVRTGRAEPV